ncbi:meckelin isoform X1 [Ixodes scapularis]
MVIRFGVGTERGRRLVILAALVVFAESRYLLKHVTPNDCDEHSYYNDIAHNCVKCGANGGQEGLQVASKDGLSCKCLPRHRMTVRRSATKLSCVPCPPNQVASSDGWECVLCAAQSPFQSSTNSCSSCTDGVFEEVLDDTGSKWLTCKKCHGQTWPDPNLRKCVVCPPEFQVADNSTCSCPPEKYVLTDGSCLPQDMLDANLESAQHITYEGGTILSMLFKDILQASLYNCKVYSNETACQIVANLCVLTFYSRGSGTSVCDRYLKLSEGVAGRPRQGQGSVPWLFYLEDDAAAVMSRTDVPNQFTIKRWKETSYLHFVAAKYSLKGKFMGIQRLEIQELMLCGTSLANADVLRFGTTFFDKCQKSVRDLWDSSQIIFYELFLESKQANEDKIYPVPAKIENMEKNLKKLSDEGVSTWQLVRRFFLLDPMSGNGTDTAAPQKSPVRFLRYAKDINIHITMHKKVKPGTIYPPLLTVTYGEVARDAYEQNLQVPVSFSVTYSSDRNQTAHDMPIAIGVLSSLAILWACIQMGSWARRSGKTSVNIVALLKLIIFTCASLSNVFLMVVLCASLNWLVMYKMQDVVHLLLPSPHQEQEIKTFIIFAFFMKALYLLHIVFVQSSVDVFFLDWERPHATPSWPRHPRPGRSSRLPGADDSSHPPSGSDAGSAAGESTTAVSIWRSYFVANEWSELQCHRRVSLPMQLLALLLLLKGLGLEYLTLATPESYYVHNLKNANIPFSATCRFALAASLYLSIAVLQVFFHKFIYERFYEDKLQHFVDLCSVSNISVFIFVQPKFGYYIHGRSAQGQADVSMREMHELLRREEEDLCGHRGLLPDTEQQTFQMALPASVYEQYCRMRRPLTMYTQAPDRIQIADGHLSRANIDTVVNTYNIVTKFLSAFLDHKLSARERTHTMRECGHRPIRAKPSRAKSSQHKPSQDH